MARTRAQVEAKIADDLERSDLTMQITDAVDTAIRFYENERFRFNTNYQATVTLSSSANYIALTALPYRYLDFDRVRVVHDANNSFELMKRDYYWITARQDIEIFAEPQEYAVYAEKMLFDSGDSQATTIVIDGLVSLGNTASNSYSSSDTSAWFNDAYNLVRAYAKHDLYLHVIKDTELAGLMQITANKAFDMLKGKVNTIATTGQMRPTDF